jgi:diguanylate cyclase (GGDEF)-like protein
MQVEQSSRFEETHSDLNDTSLSRRLEDTQPCRVLVVDDDDLVRARLSALLSSSHFDVMVAASGADALRIMSEKHCQVLVTDWQMPDMNGLELCRSVRAGRGEEGYVYVLMFSVRDAQADHLAGLAAGVDDYVAKTVPVAEFLARLEVARRITHVESSLRKSNRDNRRQSVTDSLTAANNLRFFVKHLPRELARAQQYGRGLAVLSCDIDDFKEINDSHGHEAGDEVLKAFVARAQSCIHTSTDWLARVGGDEFMIVLPETELHGARRVAQKLTAAFTASPVLTHAGPIPFTVSIGVTAVDVSRGTESNSDIVRLLRAADQSLYASKGRGGNQAGAAEPATRPTNTPGGRNALN